QFDALNERFSTTLSLATQAASRVSPLVPKEARTAEALAPRAAAPAAIPAPPPRPSSTPPAAPPSRATQQEEAVRDMMDKLKEASESRLAAAPPRAPGAPPAATARPGARGDTELVASLTQIIQQLEENTGAGKNAAAAAEAQKKIVK
ncbi:MAG: hypothetical protein HY053_09420, partial [Proteobacteria bacterium]|nr:hypothetical protein [Pseudomonadota bacterium]